MSRVYKLHSYRFSSRSERQRRRLRPWEKKGRSNVAVIRNGQRGLFRFRPFFARAALVRHFRPDARQGAQWWAMRFTGRRCRGAGALTEGKKAGEAARGSSLRPSGLGAPTKNGNFPFASLCALSSALKADRRPRPLCSSVVASKGQRDGKEAKERAKKKQDGHRGRATRGGLGPLGHPLRRRRAVSHLCRTRKRRPCALRDLGGHQWRERALEPLLKQAAASRVRSGPGRLRVTL